MKKALLTISFLALCAPSAFATAYGKVNSGNRLFKKGEYGKAVEKYRDAQISDPSNEKINFNIGNAFHKAGEYERAQGEYEKALLSKNPGITERALYNLGNNCVMLQKTDEAIEYYKKALDINPNDLNAKYNIEFLRLIKANPSAAKNPAEGKEGKGKKNQGKEGKGEQGKEEKGKEEGVGKEEKKGEMSKEDAESILQYYNDAEKQAAEKRKMRAPKMPKTDEDW
jgi:Ca-activated chloride channel family protein